MRIMAYNILEGGTGRIDPIAEVIRQADPDVVVVPEAWDAELFRVLADRLGMEGFRAEKPGQPEGAVGLLSRWPIKEAVNYGPLDGRLTRAALHATVELGDGKEITVVGVHLHPRERVADEEVRLRELPPVLEMARQFAGRPHVLAGDFNAHHPEQIIDLSQARESTRKRAEAQGGVIPREVIRQVLEAGYVDAHAVGRRPEEFETSFTTSHPVLRVDYVFVPEAWRGAVKGCVYPRGGRGGIAKFASDHYPVVAEVDERLIG